MKIYISGKVGEETISETTRKKFERIQKMLEREGYQVFNPTSVKHINHLKFSINQRRRFLQYRNVSNYTEILRMDISELAKCDAIYMLPDFLDSPGAKAEHAFAIACKKQIFYDDELYRDGTLRSKAYNKNKFPWGKKNEQK